MKEEKRLKARLEGSSVVVEQSGKKVSLIPFKANYDQGMDFVYAFVISGVLLVVYHTEWAKNLRERSRALEDTPKHQLFFEDLHKNNGPEEKFYIINGQKAFVEIDGENLESKIIGK